MNEKQKISLPNLTGVFPKINSAFEAEDFAVEFISIIIKLVIIQYCASVLIIYSPKAMKFSLSES